MQRASALRLVTLSAGILIGIGPAPVRVHASEQAAAVAQPLGQPERNAWASLQDTSGRTVGIAALTEDSEGLHVRVQATGLPPGVHGIHIHEVASCTPPDFTSAGAHFNPGRRQHGMQNLEGVHAGDLENLVVEVNGTAVYETLNTVASLGLGNPAANILDGNGSALVIHANQDDNVSNPDGNSGARIACGVIVQS
jgi:Cu-Zn family superoxide dismutase